MCVWGQYPRAQSRPHVYISRHATVAPVAAVGSPVQAAVVAGPCPDRRSGGEPCDIPPRPDPTSSQNLRNNGARLAQSWITVRVWRDFAHHHTVIQTKHAPLRQTRTVTLGGGPKQYDTALTSEDGLWARKGWAGKWQP